MQAVSLATMRNEALQAEQADPARTSVWKEGGKTFFFKGTNGRWKGVLSTEELALYDKTVTKVLTSDCRAWLEQ